MGVQPVGGNEYRDVREAFYLGLQIVVLVSSLLVVGFLVLLRAHTDRLLLPWLAIAWAGLLALGLLLQALLPLPHPAPEDRAFLYPDAGWAYEQEQSAEARSDPLLLVY